MTFIRILCMLNKNDLQCEVFLHEDRLCFECKTKHKIDINTSNIHVWVQSYTWQTIALHTHTERRDLIVQKIPHTAKRFSSSNNNKNTIRKLSLFPTYHYPLILLYCIPLLLLTVNFFFFVRFAFRNVCFLFAGCYFFIIIIIAGQKEEK